MQLKNFMIEAQIEYNEDSIEKFLKLCEDAIENITSDEQAHFKLKSAVHELLINSLEHGYKKNSGKISVSMKKVDTFVYFDICDEGKGFDKSLVNLNKTVKNIDLATNRGWGLVITNKLSENFEIFPNKPSGTKVSLVISLQEDLSTAIN